MTETAGTRTGIRRAAAWPLVSIGAVCGLAWAAGLRAFMAEIAGPTSTVEWVATFEGILLPGVIAGMLLGWAEHLRRTGGRRGWRWLALAPLVFVVANPGIVVTVFTEGGIGGGALGVALFGMAGGHALAGRGPVWARAVTGAFALLPMVAAVVVAVVVSGSPGVNAARGAWVAALFVSSLAVLSLACAIPHRAVDPDREERE